MKRRFIPVRRFFPTPPLSSFVAAAGRQGVDPNQGKDGSRSSLDNNEWFFLPFYFATAQPLARTFFSKKYRYIRTVIVNTFHGKRQREDEKTSVEGKQRN